MKGVLIMFMGNGRNSFEVNRHVIFVAGKGL